MARYIDADALIKKIFPYDVVDKKIYAINAEAVYKAIQNATSADVVEVVRCKDCKACDVIYPVKSIGEDAIEAYFCIACQAYRQPTDFCSYGKRKEK